MFGKFFIVSFQWNRYFLCFINDQKYYQTSQSTLYVRIIFIIALILTIFSSICCIILFIRFASNSGYLYDLLWCTYDINIYEAILAIIFLLIMDWSILILYYVTFINLTNKLSKLM